MEPVAGLTQDAYGAVRRAPFRVFMSSPDGAGTSADVELMLVQGLCTGRGDVVWYAYGPAGEAVPDHTMLWTVPDHITAGVHVHLALVADEAGVRRFVAPRRMDATVN